MILTRKRGFLAFVRSLQVESLIGGVGAIGKSCAPKVVSPLHTFNTVEKFKEAL